MKLNPDCLRDVMSAIESLPPDNNSLGLDVPGYSEEEVSAYIRFLEESGYAKVIFLYFDGSSAFNVEGLTAEGYELLAGFRNKTRWNSFKNSCKKIASFSFPILKDLLIDFLKSKL